MAPETPTVEQRRAATARLLSVDPQDLDYIGDEPPEELGSLAGEVPLADEVVSEIEVAAAEVRGLVVPNRISYGVYLQTVGFDGSRTRIAWKALIDGCTRTTWHYIWSTQFSRYEQAGWCRRPQTDSYDARYRIYWQA